MNLQYIVEKGIYLIIMLLITSVIFNPVMELYRKIKKAWKNAKKGDFE